MGSPAVSTESKIFQPDRREIGNLMARLTPSGVDELIRNLKEGASKGNDLGKIVAAQCSFSCDEIVFAGRFGAGWLGTTIFENGSIEVRLESSDLLRVSKLHADSSREVLWQNQFTQKGKTPEQQGKMFEGVFVIEAIRPDKLTEPLELSPTGSGLVISAPKEVFAIGDSNSDFANFGLIDTNKLPDKLGIWFSRSSLA